MKPRRRSRPVLTRAVPRIALALALCGAAAPGTRAAAQVAPAEWTSVGRDAGGTRHAPLEQVNRDNVAQLQVAWTYRTGELERVKAPGLKTKVTFECTPLVVDGVMYLSTPTARVIALDAKTGRELWMHDPRLTGFAFAEGASRGVSYWKSAENPQERRIFVGTLDARLVAIDAATGAACADFGKDGAIDLAAGLANATRGLYSVTSPPAIFGDAVIVGSAIGDNQRFDTTSGMVRAFDVRSGKLLWSWDAIPRQPGDPGADTWRGDEALKTGAANVWSIISVDVERGLVFLPTSCPAPDFYGGKRLGNNLFANSVVALDAKTGKPAWHFQVVHHDVWDYDVASQPVLFDFRRDGTTTPAVAVGTKMGHIFLLDRANGKPLTAVEERPVPSSDVPGEETSPTQPFPALPALGLHKAEPWGSTAAEQQQAEAMFAQLRYEGIFTPPSLGGSLLAPGNVGGINWSGMTVDTERQILVTNVNRVATSVRLIPQADYGGRSGGSRLGEEFARQAGTPFGMARRTLRHAASGLPATKPPWGTLAAIDLAAGKLLWEVPLGYTVDPKLEPRAREWGSPNLGGAITTASGLVFVAASRDGHFRAFDIETGKGLWEAELPAGGQATPMTYEADGKQYVVICAGGHARLGTKLGDYVVAYALP
ncbi:MAG: pyrroloquinoline quinone-dependent dehydrogenase [Pirellulales bacterium]